MVSLRVLDVEKRRKRGVPRVDSASHHHLAEACLLAEDPVEEIRALVIKTPDSKIEPLVLNSITVLFLAL